MLTQQSQEIARSVPDPFPSLEGVGSGHETSETYIKSQKTYPRLELVSECRQRVHFCVTLQDSGDDRARIAFCTWPNLAMELKEVHLRRISRAMELPCDGSLRWIPLGGRGQAKG